MLKDRQQKESALKFIVAQQWFPQMEIDVKAQVQTSKKPLLLTDIDVLASIPDPFRGLRNVLFDCKTKASESPINRALWQKGLIHHVNATHGYCILKKDKISVDHRISASELGVTLMTEKEFELYAATISPEFADCDAACAKIDLWEDYFAIGKTFPKLRDAVEFTRSGYWMLEKEAGALRNTLVSLQQAANELDPSKPSHVSVVGNHAALFLRSLSGISAEIFHAYLKPKSNDDLSEALKLLLYGGRSAYEHRNQLWKLLKRNTGVENPPDLQLPEWDRFLKFFRQILDAPGEVLYGALLCREIAFCSVEAADSVYAKELANSRKQGARFAILCLAYLEKATGLPPELSDSMINRIGALQNP